MPIPLPSNYVSGIDLQWLDFDNGAPSYLRGTFSPRGWWYYYLYAITIKIPLGTWVLFGLACVSGLCDRQRLPNRNEILLLCTALAFFAFVSFHTGFSQHLRYLLPAFPFVVIWLGRLAPAFNRQHCVSAAIAAGALAWSIASSLWYYPHSLSYFNELAGGPLGGPRHLINSNIDWGQDLLSLRQWLRAHPEVAPIRLAYFGYYDPIFLGVDYISIRDFIPAQKTGGTPTIQPGWYAISVNFVRGQKGFTYNSDGSHLHLEQGALTAFQELVPVATAGYSIYVFQVTQ